MVWSGKSLQKSMTKEYINADGGSRTGTQALEENEKEKVRV